jgi:hypothetical protein
MVRRTSSAHKLGTSLGPVVAAALVASLTLAAWLSPMTHVQGHVIGGGPVAGGVWEVRFEQRGEVVAQTQTTPYSEDFELWLRPGSYEVIVTGTPCPRTPVTVQRPRAELVIECNLAGWT